jgi:iron complex outermembrane receptor protein
MVYGMCATAYDPAAVGIFSVTPATTLALTSARILETGLKFITPDRRTELTFAAYDIDRRNVYVALTNAVSTLAGEITTKRG